MICQPILENAAKLPQIVEEKVEGMITQADTDSLLHSNNYHCRGSVDG